MKTTGMRHWIVAALVAGAGAFACADDAPGEVVVAFGEAEFWLGGDEEEVVASGEGEFWLGPDELVVADAEKEFALMPSWAWQVGDAAFAITNDVGELIVFGTGAAGGSDMWPDGLDRDAVKGVVVQDGVTGIGARFFKKCYNLNSFTGGKNLAAIGEKAFYLCLSLEQIAIDNAEFDLEKSGLADAIVLQSAIDGDGKVYVIPAVSIPGYKAVLKGTNDLGDPLDEWQTVDPSKPMKESGCHFFKYVLVAE